MVTPRSKRQHYIRSGDTLQHICRAHNHAARGYGQDTILPWSHQAVHRTTTSALVAFLMYNEYSRFVFMLVTSISYIDCLYAGHILVSCIGCVLTLYMQRNKKCNLHVHARSCRDTYDRRSTDDFFGVHGYLGGFGPKFTL